MPGPKPTGRLSVVSDSWVSRRTLFIATATTVTAAGLNTGLSGCEAEPVEPDQPAEAPIEALTPVLIQEQELIALYQRALVDYPELATVLAGLQDQSIAHVDALMQAAPAAAAQASTTGSASKSSGSTSATPSTDSSPSPAPPADAATARSDLERAIDAMAGSLRAAALRAEGYLAALLGSCAASTACHSRLLSS